MEWGFRALMRVGRHWERTRRADTDQVAHQWLVLAATLWTLAIETRDEAEWGAR